jgi:hypothetical protein
MTRKKFLAYFVLCVVALGALAACLYSVYTGGWVAVGLMAGAIAFAGVFCFAFETERVADSNDFFMVTLLGVSAWVVVFFSFQTFLARLILAWSAVTAAVVFAIWWAVSVLREQQPEGKEPAPEWAELP